MEWIKLTKKDLKNLRNSNIHVLVKCDSTDLPYDIINFLDLSECGLSPKGIRRHWGSSLATMFANHDYDDEEVLDLFTHYMIIEDIK